MCASNSRSDFVVVSASGEWTEEECHPMTLLELAALFDEKNVPYEVKRR